ncbi:glutaminase A [Myxococcaceae bacterium JPH2]|nr:glutaminase A [Myxococcaceae bacterium JPH2]
MGLPTGALALAPQADASTSSSKQEAAKQRADITDEQAKSAIQHAHDQFRYVKDGKNADYIPFLAQVNPDYFGIVLVTVDGRVFEVGDSQQPFAIESVSKPFTLARLLQDVGAETVETKIGANATGAPFNSITVIEENKEAKRPPAGNPLVNAGAIASVSMVPAGNADERWARILGTYNLFAGRNLSVNQEVYRSESDTNTRNRAIAWLLKSYDVIPGDPMEALDIYTRQCSVAITAKDLAVMGATLANGGVNPLTGKRVIDEKNAEKVLSMMLTTGLYENSGKWSFDVGLPAKSGVGGGIVAVVPGRFAIATFSPPLDEAGNSVRGQKAVQSIVDSIGGDVFNDHAPGTGQPAARP